MTITTEELCYDVRVRIDGKDIDDLSKDKLGEAIDKVLLLLKKRVLSGDIRMKDLLENLVHSDHEYDEEPCETCGHTYEKYTYELT